MIIVIFFKEIQDNFSNIERIDNVIDVIHSNNKLTILYEWKDIPQSSIFDLSSISHYQVIP